MAAIAAASGDRRSCGVMIVNSPGETPLNENEDLNSNTLPPQMVNTTKESNKKGTKYERSLDNQSKQSKT